MRYKVYRMLDVLYSLELMDWDATYDVAYDAAWDAWDAEVACDAYFKKLKEVRDEK